MTGDAWEHGGGDLGLAAQALAEVGCRGALLRVEVEFASLKAQRAEGLSRSREATFLHRAWALAVDSVPAGSVGRRQGWSVFEFILEGGQGSVSGCARQLLSRLSKDADAGRLTWQLVAVDLFLEEPERTFCCDPGYDLAGVTGNVIAWVEPYSGPDWREPQRYPVVKFLGSGHRCAGL